MFASLNARALGLSLSAEETIELAAGERFEGVDLLVRDLLTAGDDPAGLRARMEERGLRGGSWPFPFDWRRDEAGFRAGLERLPRLAEAAATLGLLRTGTWVLPEAPSAGPARSAHRAAVLQMHLDRLGAIARVLDGFGIRLGLEVIGVESFRTGRGLPLFHRLADVGEILMPLREAVPNVGIICDGFHLHAAGEALEVGLGWGVDSIIVVHLADLPAGASPDRSAIRDADRGLPGEQGAIDARGLLGLLDRAGYRGPVIAEPLAGCRSLAGLTPREVVRKARAALDAVWPEST